MQGEKKKRRYDVVSEGRTINIECNFTAPFFLLDTSVIKRNTSQEMEKKKEMFLPIKTRYLRGCQRRETRCSAKF